MCWGITNIYLAQHFGALVGKFPMTSRTTDVEGLEGGKNILGICVFMFVTLCKTSSFLPIWPLNISFCEICRAEQKQACVKINVELFQLCWDDLFVWNLVTCVAVVILGLKPCWGICLSARSFVCDLNRWVLVQWFVWCQISLSVRNFLWDLLSRTKLV